MALDKLQTDMITDSAITAVKIADGTVVAAEIAADAIDGTKIADNAIDSEHYTDGSVDLAHLAADSVDGTKIADNAINSEHYTDASIDAAHLSANSVDSDSYVDGSIDTAHVADNQITLAKMEGATDGQIITYDASGDPVRVGPGTDGQVLTSTGAGSPPAFEAAAAAGGITLGTVVATTSGTSVTFGSIPTGTKRIIISLDQVSTGGTSKFEMTIGDSGGLETSGYTGNCANGAGGDGDYGASGSFLISALNTSAGNTNSMCGHVTLVLVDASTFTWAESGALATDGGVDNYTSSGTKSLSAELTQLQITTQSADTFDQGKINIQYE